jgi:hypothetical protein
MNELTQLQEFGRDLGRDLPGPAPAVRHRIISSFRPDSRRARWPRQPRHCRRAAAPPGYGGGHAGDAQAARILNHAACAALRQPAPVIRRSDFVFRRELEMAATITMRSHRPPAGIGAVGPARTVAAGLRPAHRLAARAPLLDPAAPSRRTVARDRPAGLHRRAPGPRPERGGTSPAAAAQDSAVPSRRSCAGCRPPNQPCCATSTTTWPARTRRTSRPSSQPATRSAMTHPPRSLAATFQAVAHIPGVTVVHGAVSAGTARHRVAAHLPRHE